ncbi:response regulator [Sediminibacter sp. Hel_I_10]|uniref:response regulator n=1 Tax=Sediminibacter sp. Hel_I_10 TaxID=1392490 RepID=UPI00047B2123|nr:response regulator [Sediminibacter sp. Hel_I_10]
MNFTSNIYVIDDDEIHQFTMKKLLSMLGLSNHVTKFRNGEEAITFLKTQTENKKYLPDIIYLDINMPIMNGFEFLEEFSKLKSRLAKQVKIYMVSSSVDDVDIKKAIENKEIVSYLTKPIDLNELKSTIIDTKIA